MICTKIRIPSLRSDRSGSQYRRKLPTADVPHAVIFNRGFLRGGSGFL